MVPKTNTQNIYTMFLNVGLPHHQTQIYTLNLEILSKMDHNINYRKPFYAITQISYFEFGVFC